jgi:hypothetical protein
MAAVSWPTLARACSCRPDDPVLVRPPWPAESGLRLVGESLELDCFEVNMCRWRSVHVYARDEPGEPAKVAMVLPFIAHAETTVRWGGRPVEIIADEQQLEQAKIWVHEYKQAQDRNRINYDGVYLWLEDDGQQLIVELEIEGVFTGEGFDWGQCCRLTALEIRHPFVPRHSRGNVWRWSDPTTVYPGARTFVHVDADPGLLVEVDGKRRNPARRGPASFDVASDFGAEFMVFERERLTGGPFIAIGGAILDANPVRGRIGWQHAYPFPSLFYSAALETDFTSEFTFVPAVEITHGGQMVMATIFPRAGFGVGLPVQFLPDPRPGLRAQVSFSWIVFSILTTFDWLPMLAPTGAGTERPHMFKLAFLGQFSF